MPTVTTVYRNVQGIRTAIKDVGRARHIAAVLAKHGLGHVVAQLGFQEVIGIRSVVPQPPAEGGHVSLARRIRLAMEELGPTFVKLGQILSTRADLLGKEVATEFQGLQDDVPKMGWPDVQHQIESELECPVEDLFASVEHHPLASASVAQVHQAKLKTGEEVVLKIRRRGIQTSIMSDLSILQFMAVQAEAFIPELRLMNPVGIVAEFTKALTKELDFSSERSNIERFRTNFADFEGIHIPKVYQEYCTDAVLTMEMIHGIKVTRAVEEYGADPYKAGRIMLKALFKMVFQDGFFHGDLHPGNILVQKNETIALIDFGLVGKLLPRQRDDIIDLLTGIVKEDYEIISRVFFDLGQKVPGVEYDYNAFENDVVELLDQHVAGKILSDIDVQAFFADLASGAIKHQIKMPPTYTMVFKALMTVEGIGKTLSPDINFIEESKPFIKEIMLERYSPERLLREAVDTLNSTGRFLQRFAITAPRILRDMELGRLSIRTENPKIDGLMAQQRKASIRQMRATVFAGGVVAAALSYDAPGPGVLGMNIGAFAALCVAIVAGIPLMFDILRG